MRKILEIKRTLAFYIFISLFYPEDATNASSLITSIVGHYPPTFCTVAPAWLHAQDGVFYYHGDNLGGKCGLTENVWKLDNTTEPPQCSKTYDVGYTFTIYYWAGGSNYYHMHYDVLIPLYMSMYYEQSTEEKTASTLLMPVVETSRLQQMRWDTNAFANKDKWWNQLVKALAGNHSLLPLDESVRNEGGTLCFNKLHFGTPSYKKTNAALIQGFARFIRQTLGLQEQIPIVHRLAVIQRRGRRKIRNEQELVDKVQDLVESELIDFDGMSFKEQVAAVQKYTIVVGMNGAGFMNCLYLPPGSVAIQLAPMTDNLNIRQFGELIQNRGPYLEWHNTHPENHHQSKHDRSNNHPDTTVHLEEFRELIKKALAMVNLTPQKEEL